MSVDIAIVMFHCVTKEPARLNVVSAPTVNGFHVSELI